MHDLSREHIDPVELLRMVPASCQRVLDCGGASGDLPRLLKQRGVTEVVGFVNDSGSGSVLDRVVDAKPGDGELPFNDFHFDCIIAADILPRLREPEAFVERLRRVLSPQGLLLITAPNLQYYRTVIMLAQGQWRYEADGIMAHHHLRFYTGVELVELLKAGNFEVRALTRLAGEEPVRVPRDSEGYIRGGRIRIGPLSDVDYQLYLISQYLALASRADIASV